MAGEGKGLELRAESLELGAKSLGQEEGGRAAYAALGDGVAEEGWARGNGSGGKRKKADGSLRRSSAAGPPEEMFGGDRKGWTDRCGDPRRRSERVEKEMQVRRKVEYAGACAAALVLAGCSGSPSLPSCGGRFEPINVVAVTSKADSAAGESMRASGAVTADAQRAAGKKRGEGDGDRSGR